MKIYDIDNTPTGILYADEIAVLQDPTHEEYESLRAFLENELIYSHPTDYVAIKGLLGEEIQIGSEVSSLGRETEDQVGELLALQETE